MTILAVIIIGIIGILQFINWNQGEECRWETFLVVYVFLICSVLGHLFNSFN